MDQFASAHGIAGHVLSFDTRMLAWEAIPLPDIALVIANSGVPRQLSESDYNERQATCQQAVVILKQYLPHIRALRDVSVADFNRYASRLPATIQKRARHVVEECERVTRAVHCLKNKDLYGFGKLMLQGHASLRDLFEVSCPELDVLVDTASRLPGCIGARLTGAGFGGSTINLVEWDFVDDFIEKLKGAYKTRCSREADVFVTRAARGAWVEQLGDQQT
jgi:galactokinase